MAHVNGYANLPATPLADNNDAIMVLPEEEVKKKNK